MTQQHIVRLEIPQQCDVLLYRQRQKAYIQFLTESVASAAHRGWLLCAGRTCASL